MERQQSPRLLIVAVVLVIVGTLASVALLFPPLRTENQIGAIVTFVLAMGAPLGLFLGLVYALVSGRRAR